MISAQLNNGRRVSGEVRAPESASKAYLVRRLLRRHLPANLVPDALGRSNSATARWVPEPKACRDPECPLADPACPRSKDYTEWPAMFRIKEARSKGRSRSDWRQWLPYCLGVDRQMTADFDRENEEATDSGQLVIVFAFPTQKMRDAFLTAIGTQHNCEGMENYQDEDQANLRAWVTLDAEEWESHADRLAGGIGESQRPGGRDDLSSKDPIPASAKRYSRVHGKAAFANPGAKFALYSKMVSDLVGTPVRTPFRPEDVVGKVKQSFH